MPRFSTSWLGALVIFGLVGLVTGGACLNWGVEEPSDGDADADADFDADADADSDGDSEPNGDADSDVDADSDADVDVDGDADPDNDNDLDADLIRSPDAETDSEVDVETDVETDEDADTPVTCADELCLCPGHEEMIQISESVCIDRWEAVRGGARAGGDPESGIHQGEASHICHDIGKRHCTPEEWQFACRGPEGRTYPYGNTYDPTACNGIEYLEGGRLPTGSMPRCEGGFAGLYDMSGNVSEWTVERIVAGGGYRSREADLGCDALMAVPGSEFREEDTGARCCLDL